MSEEAKQSAKPKKIRRPRRVRTDDLLQMEAVECGAAALGIILAYHKRIVPLDELRVQCGVSRDGSKASNVVKAAQHYGMSCKGYRKSLEDVQEIAPPFIVFWNFNHFLVVEGFTNKHAYLNDPACGRRKVSLEDFDRGFTGVTLVPLKTEEFQAGGRRPSVTRALTQRLRGSLDALLFCVLAGLLLVIPGLAIPVMTQVFIDDVLIAGRHDWLRPLLLALGLTLVLRQILEWLQLLHLRKLKIKLAIGMSARFIWHMLRLPVGFYAQRLTGELANRVLLNDKVAGVLSGQLTQTLIDCTMVLAYVAVMLQFDPVLTAVGCALAFLNVFALQLVARKRAGQNALILQERGMVAGIAIAGLRNIETIKANAQESSFFARWAGFHAKSVNAEQDFGLSNQLLGTLPVVITLLTTVLVLSIGGLRVLQGELSLGALVAFMMLMASFQAPVGTLVGLGKTIQELRGDLTRLDDVLRHDVHPPLPPFDDTEHTAAKLHGRLEFHDVSFGYSILDPPLISKFSLTVEPGQRVALVGSSGSGKSTLAKLAAGLYQPWSGEIRIDGEPLGEIPSEVFSRSVALVDQDISLFGGRVRDNLTLWDPTIPDEDLERAARDACVYDVVGRLEGGFEASLYEGASDLSGGQRQRLEIARALVGNPTLLLLDEATAALDAETEREITGNVNRRGCTCLVVAHRLSTVRDCDKILVLKGGEVVEQGTHTELLALAGEYAGLVREST